MSYAEENTYFAPKSDIPPQTAMITSRAVVTDGYTVIPSTVLCDNVVSVLPGWEATQCWILAKPLIGFATTFAQYLMAVHPGGGSQLPEQEAGVESLIFVLEGRLTLVADGDEYLLDPGGFAFLPAGCDWSTLNSGKTTLKFQWIRKAYEPLPGMTAKLIVGQEQDLAVSSRNDYQTWSTNLVPVDDIAYDMHVNIVSFKPGAIIPLAETHVMEHGLYVLQGKGVYLLNQNWVEVQAGDFLWLRPFCPQACYAGGPTNFRYLLYKDMNRQVRLSK